MLKIALYSGRPIEVDTDIFINPGDSTLKYKAPDTIGVAAAGYRIYVGLMNNV